MYLDSTGNSPEWWHWALFGVGAALVATAAVVVSVATFGTGAAFSGMAGAIIVGAAKGALIGSAVGTGAGVVGGAIYSSITGSDMGDSILQGFLMGFGGGAIIGAVIGGIAGGTAFSSAAKAWHGGKNALTSHFKNHGIKMGFKNPVQYTKGAKSIINGGQYMAQTNAYATSVSGLKYAYVGVNHGGQLITTFFYKTFTVAKALALGLL